MGLPPSGPGAFAKCGAQFLDQFAVLVGRVCDVMERACEQRCVGLAQPGRQVDEPDIARAAGNVVAVPIGLQHLGIAAAVRVYRLGHPGARELARHVEGPAFLDAEERAVAVLRQRLGTGQIEAARQVGIDAADHLAIEPGRFAAVRAEADQGHVDRRAVDGPLLLVPGLKNARRGGDAVHDRQVGVLADRIGCDQARARQFTRLDQGARVLEPVADQVGEAREPAIIERADRLGPGTPSFPFISFAPR